MAADLTDSIMRLAATQHGALGTGQLAELGVSGCWLDNPVRRSVLQRAGTGVYTVCGAPATWQHRLAVGTIALSGGGWADVEAAIDSAVRLGLSSPSALAARLDQIRGRGRWGARTLDKLLVDSGGHTVLERRFLELVRRAGLPRPRTQVIHRRDGRHAARVDFLFDQVNVVVEVSGQHGHTSPTDRARDAQRRNELQDLGPKVYEYTWGEITGQLGFVERTPADRLEAAG